MDYLQALQNSLSELEGNSGSGSGSGTYTSLTQTLQHAQNTLAAADVISDVTGQFAGSTINSLGNTISNTKNSIGQTAGSIANNIDPYKYKNADEADYATELAALRLTSTDIDNLFTRRDSAIDDYTNVLNTEPDSTELVRIYKKRLDVLNSYIERLAVGYIIQQERSDTVIDNYYEDLDTSVPLSGDQLRTFANSQFNDLACEIAAWGIPVLSDYINGFCVPSGPTTTDCNISTTTNFNETCSNQYTDGTPDDLPQHLTWGQIETSQYNCAVGTGGAVVGGVVSGRQERGVCGLGYFIGSDDTINMTQCRLQTDLSGEFNINCANQVGGGVLTPADLTYNLNTPNGPADLTFGKSADSEACTAPSDVAGAQVGTHAKCGIGYFNGIEAPVNASHCLLGSDTDIGEGRLADTANNACRRQVGFEQGVISIDQPSQHTYGAKSAYDAATYGCWGDYRRVQCEMGYSAGVELEPWSTECVLRTDNMGGTCTNTYGDEWFPWPAKNSSWNAGCYFPDTKTRAKCMKDDMVAVGTEFTNAAVEVAGQQCTDPNLINTDTSCAYYYGPNYVDTGNTQNMFVSGNTNADDGYKDYTVDQDKCTGLMYRKKCKKMQDIGDMKNSICLWTNRFCNGLTCQERVDGINSSIDTNGGEWVALNPNHTCGTMTNPSLGAKSNMCLICTTGGLTDKYLAEDNPYFAAINDTRGTVPGLNVYDYDWTAMGTVASNDLYLTRYSAFWEDRKADGGANTSVTTNIKDAYENERQVYVPPGSDTDLMNTHLQTYLDMPPSNITCDDSLTGTCMSDNALYDGVCSSLTTNCACLQEVTIVGAQKCSWIEDKEYTSGNCIGNMATDNATCNSITDYASCETQKNFASVKMCTWVSPENDDKSGQCYRNTIFDSVCDGLEYSSCVGQKNWASVRQCYWQ